MLKTVILGSGNIGTDLMVKCLKSKKLECFALVGRSMNSAGLDKAHKLGVRYSDESIEFIEKNHKDIDVVFDATSAKDHYKHSKILKKLGIKVIDMTPARVGVMAVPVINNELIKNTDNINMVTCGGQASIPISYVIKKCFPYVNYIETISSIASRSAGPATRRNLDEYIKTTEEGIRFFSGVRESKAILNLNPANPCIDMQTTVLAKIDSPNMKTFSLELDKMIKSVQRYVPGYKIITNPTYEDKRLSVMVRVKGLGDYLPSYAGNLDIINCAAISVAENFKQ